MSDTTKGAARAVRDLREVVARLDELATERGRLITRRDVLMARCRERGVPPGVIAAEAGVSAGRVSQVAPAPTTGGAVPEPAPVPEPTSSAVAVPHVPAGPLLSGRATTRKAAPYAARVSAWVDLDDLRGADSLGHDFVLGGYDLSDTLAAIDTRVTRVYVTGEWAELVPQVAGSGAANVRAWGMAGADGWTVAPAGHYTDKGAAVFRWTDGERTVEVMSAAAWFGDADPVTCANAWAILSDWVGHTFPGAVLLSTPATTGRDLWVRTIGARQSYPTLSAPVRELITATSGQGRTEVVNSGHWTAAGGFTYMDARFAYAALVHGMPVGEPEHVTPERVPAAVSAAGGFILAKRGRWRCTVTVPAGWAHVGILGRRTAAGWDYPSEPGTSWETWADAAELRLAIDHGWTVELHEGLVWREGKPLTEWRDALLVLWETAGVRMLETTASGKDADAAVWAAVRGAVRALVLFAVGAFAAGTPTRERVVDTEAEVPAGARVTPTEDGRLRYVEAVPATAWQDEMSHPEWAATIWARARVALLEHRLPDGTKGGALHLDPSQVMGFRTDAIYVAGEAPEWPDDGKPGRFRVKGQITEPVRWPASSAELLELRERSEA